MSLDGSEAIRPQASFLPRRGKREGGEPNSWLPQGNGDVILTARFPLAFPCRGVLGLRLLSGQVLRHQMRDLHPAQPLVHLLPVPALNPTPSLASKNARICSRLNFSPACMLTINSQHAGSPLQAHLLRETNLPPGSSCTRQDHRLTVVSAPCYRKSLGDMCVSDPATGVTRVLPCPRLSF
jgi:hypothetical protein